MPLFPAIEPNTRDYDLAGDFPMLEELSWPSFSTRYRTGNTPSTNAGLQLTLTYLDLEQTQWIQLREHYIAQQGGLVPFALPPIILQGQAFSLVRPGSKWRYLSPPQEQHRSGGLATITVNLESTGFDYGAITNGKRFQITTSIAAAMGVQAAVTSNLASGTPEINGADLSVDIDLATANGIQHLVTVNLGDANGVQHFAMINLATASAVQELVSIDLGMANGVHDSVAFTLGTASGVQHSASIDLGMANGVQKFVTITIEPGFALSITEGFAIAPIVFDTAEWEYSELGFAPLGTLEPSPSLQLELAAVELL